MATTDAIKKVFATFHAAYGDRAITRMARNAQADVASGLDKGVEFSIRVWHQTTRRYSDALVMQASIDVMKECPVNPPTLPQFMATCAALYRAGDYERTLALPHPSPRPMPAEVRKKLAEVKQLCAESALLRQVAESVLNGETDGTHL